MADVVPFSCVRPREDMVHEVASLPYDVYNRYEAKAEIDAHPYCFLKIDMPEALFPDSIDQNDDCVFEKARELLESDIDEGIYTVDEQPCYYLYRLTATDGRSQTGVVGCASVNDYLEGTIKRHEKTKPDKEINRIRHVDTCDAHTGPIFLAYRSNGSIESIMGKMAALPPLYDFVADDGVGHTVWRVDDPRDEETIRHTFAQTSSLYLADGHHRTASAVKAGVLRREAAQADSSETLASDHFLSVIFPSDQLDILDYNRTVSGLNGLSHDELISKIQERFTVSGPQALPVQPRKKGTFGMHVSGMWYELTIKDEYLSDDPVAGLDVSLLQDNLLDPILGIEDPRSDDRIDFIGGVRGLAELERRVAEDMSVAFAMYPTSIEELFAVADADRLMPPKSTWFEPKPRSGIFIHRL